MTTRQQRATPMLAAAQAGAAGAILLACMKAFPDIAPVLPSSVLAAAGTTAIAGGAALWVLGRQPEPTAEDLACGTWISGIPGSGKTSYVIGHVRNRFDRGEGGIWLSSKGGGALLPYLPADASERVDWIAPASRHPRGVNLLRVYRGDAREQELVAGYTVGVFSRLYPHLSENMAELIRMGTMALLSYSVATRQGVTLAHLYLFFHSPGYRQRVLERATNPVLRHAFGDTEVEARTVAAVLRQLRRTVASEALLVTLGQVNGIDLQAAMSANPGRWVVTDADERRIGPEASDLINQVLVSQLELLTPGRGFPRPLWHAVADEIERYQSPSFLRAIEISREYRVAWFLVHQASGQLSEQVLLAAKMCGTHVYLQQHPDDVAAAQRATGRIREREVDFSRLPKRYYIARMRRRGRATDMEGYTPDVPAADDQVAAKVRALNGRGADRDAILGPIYRLLELGQERVTGATNLSRGALAWD